MVKEDRKSAGVREEGRKEGEEDRVRRRQTTVCREPWRGEPKEEEDKRCRYQWRWMHCRTLEGKATVTATATNKEHLFGKLWDARNSVFILRLRGTKSEASSKGEKKCFWKCCKNDEY